MGQPRPLVVYFHSNEEQFLQKIVGFSGNQTHIVRLEGKHDDHLNTAMVHFLNELTAYFCFNKKRQRTDLNWRSLCCEATAVLHLGD